MRKLAFIGVGNMATAIISGITSQKGSVAWTDLILFNRHRDKIQKYADFGAHIADTLEEAVELADVIFLCVKPQNFPEILPLLAGCDGVSEKLFVSVAAGISMKTVSVAASGAAIIRAMPNTPMLIGKGVIAICRNSAVSDDDLIFVRNAFECCGKVIEIDESEMNRIISVTGSSPAYVFMMIDAMLEGASAQGLLSESSDLGLTEKELIDCICDTIIGAAELMKSDIKSPSEQIATVASKGGTTERAVAELESYKLREAIVSAMLKCTARADELGKDK